jgi:hypothetical protein
MFFFSTLKAIGASVFSVELFTNSSLLQPTMVMAIAAKIITFFIIIFNGF